MNPCPPETVEQRAYVSAVTELVPFDDGTGEGSYRARTADDRQFVVPELVAETLRLLNGERNAAEIARRLSARAGSSFAADDVQALIDQKLVPAGLALSGAAPVAGDRTTKRFEIQSSLGRLEFILRVSLLSREFLSPITRRLTGLYQRNAAILCMLMCVAAHAAFYMEPGRARLFSRSPRDLCLSYFLVFASMLIHEFGHASASRRFGCEHGDIGFTLYLIFPGLYADMSNVWKLPGRQRAVIDIGGLYFQLAIVPLLWILHCMTGQPCFATAIYAIDLMAVFALNPFFKFDGYWLVVDLFGLPNLQQRAFNILRESGAWIVRGQVPPTLRRISGKTRRTVLTAYSASMLVGMAVAIPYLLRRVPFAFVRFRDSVAGFSTAWRSSPEAAMLEIGKMIASLFVFLFIYRVLLRLSRPFFSPPEIGPAKAELIAAPVWPFWRAVLNSACLLFVVDFCMIAGHELAHGLIGLLLGGRFPFVQMFVTSGRSVVIFPYGAPYWKNPLFLLAGYSFQFVLQLALLAVLRKAKGQGEWLYLASLTGAIAGASIIVSAGLLLIGDGEVAAALQLLRLPGFIQVAVKTVWLACELLLTAIFLRRLFSWAAGIQRDERYSSRLRAVLMTWGLPLLLLALPSAWSVLSNSASLGGGLIAGVALLAVLPLLISLPPVESDSGPKDLPNNEFSLQHGLGSHAALAAGLLALQMIVFGSSTDHPRGLFLSKHPAEAMVAACNVKVRVEKDRTAHVTMLMRPFVRQHGFLWERIRQAPPDEWTHYMAFTKDNLPRLLPGKGWKIETNYFDPVVPFYIGGQWSRGARVIEAAVDLPAPTSSAGPEAITMSDFWKRQRVGNLDLFEVTLGQGVSLVSLAARPRTAAAPKVDSTQTVRWLTPTYRDAFESVSFTLAGLR